ncbi:MAG: hypothetical protein ACD_4C00286G0003 [uncultured bacterium (gcode 4)]|uniref:Uncharacterized protein n=1 Tax=uncultured bacterium (gcode 4) TaxID=1234023 RepID=K2GSX3_9BACT|nr:MAG: hypothetical protein ACD_4C00286G0003 [uncultured bacterium (gcode 4)]
MTSMIDVWDVYFIDYTSSKQKKIEIITTEKTERF